MRGGCFFWLRVYSVYLQGADTAGRNVDVDDDVEFTATGYKLQQNTLSRFILQFFYYK